MKRVIVLSLALSFAVIFLAAQPASAHRVHFSLGLGFWGPPVFYAPPPVLYVPPPAVYYPPYRYYGPSRYWVPGHWERRWTPRGWRTEWIQGHWRYRY